jgi:hypothetical protein
MGSFEFSGASSTGRGMGVRAMQSGLDGMSRPTARSIRRGNAMPAILVPEVFVRWRNLAQSRPLNAPTPIAPPDGALKTPLGRYSYVMQKAGLTRGDAGVTGHGLRAGFVCRLLQDLGLTPAIKGSTGRHVDPQLDLLHHLIAREAVGHSRKAVIGSYAGSPGVQRRVLASDYLRRRGLLLPGRDARCVDINARRITVFLQRQTTTDEKLSSTEFDEVSREQ